MERLVILLIVLGLLLGACGEQTAPEDVQRPEDIDAEPAVYPTVSPNMTVDGTDVTYEGFIAAGAAAILSEDRPLVLLEGPSQAPFVGVPWYASSSRCSEDDLKQEGFPVGLDEPTHTYIMVTDEFSVAAQLIALSGDEERLDALFRTHDMMVSDWGSLPSWRVRVDHHGIQPVAEDGFESPATDADARLGLAYLHASQNPAFSPAAREKAHDRFLRIADDHLRLEYAVSSHPVRSPVSGREMTHLLAGGPETAEKGVTGMETWIGYYGDVARLLWSAYEQTGREEFRERTYDVIDQFLVASRYVPNGENAFPDAPTAGNKQVGWRVVDGTLVVDERNGYHARPETPAWDDADAPRALTVLSVIGRMLDAGEDPSDPTLEAALGWGEAASGLQESRRSVVQLNADGTPHCGACGGDPAYHGLALPAHELFDRDGWRAKVSHIAEQGVFKTSSAGRLEFLPYAYPCPGLSRMGPVFVNIATGLEAGSDAD